MIEGDSAQGLATCEGGQCEVRTPAGNIDVLTPKYVYEVKVARQWKAALGQVLAYARAYPDPKPRLYLFGELGGITKKAVEEHYRAAGVGVVWHREEDLPVPPPGTLARHLRPDSISLSLVVVDAIYAIRTSTSIRLPTLATPIAPEVLEAYADEALAVFDPLLDNEVSITVSAAVGGAMHAVEHVRPVIRGTPVCYQPVMTIQPREFGKVLRVTLSGVRTTLPSGTRSSPGATSSGTQPAGSQMRPTGAEASPRRAPATSWGRALRVWGCVGWGIFGGLTSSSVPDYYFGETAVR